MMYKKFGCIAVLAVVAFSCNKVLETPVQGAEAVLTETSAETAVVNGASFGLKGDGSDETAKLQTAINASAGKTLVLPSGTFFTGQLRLVSNITITGTNVKLRMIQGDYDNRMMSLKGLQNVEIANLEIALNGIRGDIWDGTAAIQMENCTNIKIHNCFIHDNTYVAIRLTGGNNNIRINNNFIENTDVGVHANNVNTNLYIIGNTFSKGTSEGVTIYGYNNDNYPTNFLIDSNIILDKKNFGINIPLAKYGTITHNTINGCYGGITFHDAVSVGNDNYYTTDMTVTNNYINNATFGIVYVGDRMTITNNKITNIQQSGISINDFNDKNIVTTGVKINKNTMSATGLAGGGAAGISINNCTASNIAKNSITNCGQSSSSIRFNGNCNKINITGNNCGNGMLQSPNTTYSSTINITNNVVAQTYFPIPQSFNYNLALVVSGNTYTIDTTYNTAPDADGGYKDINSFNVRTQYSLAAGTVRYIASSWKGRILSLYSTNSFYIQQGNNIVLKGGAGSYAKVPAKNRITLKFDGQAWTEISRSF